MNESGGGGDEERNSKATISDETLPPALALAADASVLARIVDKLRNLNVSASFLLSLCLLPLLPGFHRSISRPHQVVRLLSQRKILIAVSLYTLLGFADVMYEETFPLWSLNPVCILYPLIRHLLPPAFRSFPGIGTSLTEGASQVSLEGLGFEPRDIGLTTATGSALNVFWQLLGYPWLGPRSDHSAASSSVPNLLSELAVRLWFDIS